MARLWLNGELVEASEARIPALDRGVLWGDGLFETLRAYEGRSWAVDEHYARLRAGSQVLDLPIPDEDVVEAAFVDVLEANGLSEAGVRVTVTRGAGPPEPHAEAEGRGNTIVTAWPLPDYATLYGEGAALVTLPDGARPLAGVKTTSYAASVAGRVAARRAGADDGLFVSPEEAALEATGSNLFVASDGELRTPPLQGVLPGVTRERVLDVAEEVGFEVVERRIPLDELFEADEVVLTSSLREVYPVRSVDGRPTPRRGIAARLRDAYRARVRRELNLA